MNLTTKIAALGVLMLPLGSQAENLSSAPKVGDEYEITRSYETSEQGSDGSTSSSSGHETIVERVIGVREAGLELEYDLPRGATKEDRARSWQFPARVFRRWAGPMELLNRTELQTRLDGWLKSAGWSREVCGRWIFTWNAFRIECNPLSVLETLEVYDLRSIDLREGGKYSDSIALQPGVLTRTADGRSGATYIAGMELDPTAVHRARAESDVVVGEIMKSPVAFDAALREREKEAIKGTVLVTIDTDAGGQAWRRTKVTTMETRKPDGVIETSKGREVLTRKLVGKGSS